MEEDQDQHIDQQSSSSSSSSPSCPHSFQSSPSSQKQPSGPSSPAASSSSSAPFSPSSSAQAADNHISSLCNPVGNSLVATSSSSHNSVESQTNACHQVSVEELCSTGSVQTVREQAGGILNFQDGASFRELDYRDVLACAVQNSVELSGENNLCGEENSACEREPDVYTANLYELGQTPQQLGGGNQHEKLPVNTLALEHHMLYTPTQNGGNSIAFDEARTIQPLEASAVELRNVVDMVLIQPPEVPKSGLQRAQTMPSGSCPNVDEERNLSGMKSLIRSQTEKGKQSKFDKENSYAAPANKLSNRKKKKLIKRIATVTTDGRVEFDFLGSTRFAPELFGPELIATSEDSASEGDEGEKKVVPPLQIAMLIVGTRGDVQPFIAIGKHLQEYGHRVRLATHANFGDFVMTSGLEFFPLGGDPKILAGYMVKNKGFLPSGPSEISTQRKQIKGIINSLLPACTETDRTGVPFRAQAVIANPPAYGHVHVAEYLKVPLHIFFTMPWTPTSEFPHPLSRVKQPAAYRVSYQVVDSLIWWGIRGMINNFRKKKLKLRPITYLSGSQGSISNLPTGYIWSPQLVPKPKDWGKNIDVVGFCFLNLAQDYKPPDSLVSWLQAGTMPIYVGFGSLPVEDPQGMTHTIVEALRQTGQRGVIFKGWGGIGNLPECPEFVYLLDNCPHDWLFPQCRAVVHHGGAGTTAAGLKAACPTTIVPFFGDQPFWGDRVYAKGVGPAPIPVGQFSLNKLVDAIHFMIQPQVKEQAVAVAKAMEGEDGVAGAVEAFHKHLPKIIPQAVPSSTSPSSFYTLFDILRARACCGGYDYHCQ